MAFTSVLEASIFEIHASAFETFLVFAQAWMMLLYDTTVGENPAWTSCSNHISARAMLPDFAQLSNKLLNTETSISVCASFILANARSHPSMSPLRAQASISCLSWFERGFCFSVDESLQSDLSSTSNDFLRTLRGVTF